MSETSQRFFVELAYNGTAYHGWQIQPNAVSVQEKLNQALSTYFRQGVETTGCGRTDTGVHAKQFFAHFDLLNIPGLPSGEQVVNSLNALLPFDIAISRFIPVSPQAHSRFDATLRAYQYFIHFHKDPFKQQASWLVKDRPDVAAMNTAAALLKEYIDFSCFSKSHTQVFTNNCKIKDAYWEETPDGLVFNISADRFLRNMVRAIVGTLMEVGKGKIKPEAIHQIIQSKNRSQAGTSVPACGLYLTKVEYPYLG